MAIHKRILKLLMIFAILKMTTADVYEYKNWAFHFPAGSNMGLFIALAVPIELPNENVFVAYNFEANYLLPGNESEIVEFPPLITDEEEARHTNKKIDRNRVYSVMEAKLQAYGFPGQNCLLRTICEVASSSLEHNGILGDLIHIILTPSSSFNLKLPPVYAEAEEYGRTNGHCKKYRKKCSISLLDIISKIRKS